ncbi:MAG: hypothetical protein ACRER2_18675 [Methylococcales bacterium]
MIEKSGSISLALATIAILGQAPSHSCILGQLGHISIAGNVTKCCGDQCGITIFLASFQLQTDIFFCFQVVSGIVPLDPAGTYKTIIENVKSVVPTETA